MLRMLCTSLISLGLGAGVVGCESNAGNGALIGGGSGAALGAIIGHQSHGNTVGGAVIGGAAGAIAGGLIGGEADRQEAERRRERDYDDNGYRYSDRPGRYYDRSDPYYDAPPPRYYEYRSYRSYPPGYTERWYTD